MMPDCPLWLANALARLTKHLDDCERPGVYKMAKTLLLSIEHEHMPSPDIWMGGPCVHLRFLRHSLSLELQVGDRGFKYLWSNPPYTRMLGTVVPNAETPAPFADAIRRLTQQFGPESPVITEDDMYQLCNVTHARKS